MDLYSSEGRQQSAASVTFAHPSSLCPIAFACRSNKGCGRFEPGGKVDVSQSNVTKICYTRKYDHCHFDSSSLVRGFNFPKILASFLLISRSFFISQRQCAVSRRPNRTTASTRTILELRARSKKNIKAHLIAVTGLCRFSLIISNSPFIFVSKNPAYSNVSYLPWLEKL